MRNSSEAIKFKPEPTFENIINDKKENNLKSIASAIMNPPAITSYEESFYLMFMNNSFKAEIFKTEPIFENTLNEIKSDHLKNITSVEMNVSAT